MYSSISKSYKEVAYKKCGWWVMGKISPFIIVRNFFQLPYAPLSFCNNHFGIKKKTCSFIFVQLHFKDNLGVERVSGIKIWDPNTFSFPH